MKFSEAILKGYEQVNGRQCKYHFGEDSKRQIIYHGGQSDSPYRCCVMGAAGLGARGNIFDAPQAWRERFRKAWGFDPAVLNNDGMRWEEIYGMAAAARL